MLQIIRGIRIRILRLRPDQKPKSDTQLEPDVERIPDHQFKFLRQTCSKMQSLWIKCVNILFMRCNP